MKKKLQILSILYAIYMSDTEDMEVIKRQMDKVMGDNNLTYHIPYLIDTRYFVNDITDLRYWFYYHMDTSKCKEFKYFAGLVDDFIDFIPAIVAERLNTPDTYNVIALYPQPAA